jgi:hypothetical protein
VAIRGGDGVSDYSWLPGAIFIIAILFIALGILAKEVTM